MIIAGIPDHRCNHLTSKDCCSLDRETNDKSRAHCSTYECQNNQVLDQVFQLSAQDASSMPLRRNYFTYAKGDFPHLLVDESMTT